MTIRNILVKQLFRVLRDLPQGTTKIDIEYTENDEESKITIYPSDDDDSEDTDIAADNPSISPDDDIINLL